MPLTYIVKIKNSAKTPASFDNLRYNKNPNMGPTWFRRECGSGVVHAKKRQRSCKTTGNNLTANDERFALAA